MTAFSATLCAKLADEASLDLKSCNIFDHQLRMNVDWMCADSTALLTQTFSYARTNLQLPLRQWGAGNVYLLVLSSWKVNIAENSIALMEL